MKRVGNLFDAIADRDNLRLAVAKALRGKRRRPEAVRFVRHLDRRLDDLGRRLREGTFPVGRFQQFVIRDPKRRVITAPCFAERVLHHAILNVCEPHFDRWLIADTFACRAGLGRSAALVRAREFARCFDYFLSLDVRQYFDSIPHDRLLDALARKFKDGRLLDLFGRVVRSYRGASGRGLPIGALTSQHFANFYLGSFDRFVKETLRARGYTRYMDDVAIWSDDRAALRGVRDQCREFLRDRLGLEFKAEPYINRTAHGMDYLGGRVFPGYCTLNRRSRVRFARRLSMLERKHAAGELTDDALQHRATALVAFARGVGVCSWQFRAATLKRLSEGGRMARSG